MTPLPGGRLLNWLLAVSVPADRREEFLGDLIEETQTDRLPRTGRLLTVLWLWRQAFGSMPSLVALRFRRRGLTAVMPAGAPTAFSYFLGNAGPRPGMRRLPFALAVVFHAGLAVLAVGSTFWHVEEVSPPEIRLPFILPRRADPPPPKRNEITRDEPSQSPSRRPPRKAPAVVPVETPPSAVEPVQPPIGTGGPSTEPSLPGVGSQSTGPSGPGCPGCGGRDPAPVRGMPPTVGEKQCVHCPLPSLPMAYRRAELHLEMLVKICVDVRGAVTSTKVLRGISPGADSAVTGTLAGWRFSPVHIDGHPVPFCYASRFVFSTAAQ